MKINRTFSVLASTLFLLTTAMTQDTVVIDEARTAYQTGLAAFNNGNYEKYFTILHKDLQAYAGVYTPLRFDGKVSWQDFIKDLGAYASVGKL